MLLLLQTHERMTSRELAQRFEVSQRTVLRDVEALSAAGVPVHTERGRGGAIVLDRRSRLDPVRLDPAELQLLAVAGLGSAQLERLGLQELGSRLQDKVAATLARRSEPTPRTLSEVLLVDAAGWFSGGRDTDLTDLVEAARARRRLRLRYRRSGEAAGRWFVADPYGLVSKAASWYLVADVDGRPRLFNVDRIEAREALAEGALLRPDQDLRSVWEDLRQGFRPTSVVDVHALLRSSRVDLARRILGSRLIAVTAPDAEWTAIVVRYPEVESVRQLLQFGDHIRVTAPAEAIDRICDLAIRLQQNHGSSDMRSS
ncbi:WYL domain-containing protein [Mesorhizobium sp. B2-6-6]|uniref:helix-turn-helix transcriptional regulator n=1 Tax=Mesorhizobium sp. B2-6-6 TaxID=2589911 RepID=UPI001AEE47CE